MPGLLSRLVNLRTSAMAAAGRSRRACSVPGAGAAAAAPRVYTPAGRPHRSSAAARLLRLLLPPPAAPPSFARSQSCPTAAAAPSPREPELRASCRRRRVCLAGKGVRRGRERGRGAQGHEGRGGKWQPLGLRPQLMLLVQPHPGEEIWLLHFSCVFGGWRGREDTESRQECSTLCSSAPFPPVRLQCPLEGWGTLASAHPSSPQGRGARGAGERRGAAIYCVLRPGGVAPVSEVEGGRMVFRPERYAWVTSSPHHFLTHRSSSRLGRGSRAGNSWVVGACTCGRLSSWAETVVGWGAGSRGWRGGAGRRVVLGRQLPGVQRIY